jgi:hypothetical protein
MALWMNAMLRRVGTGKDQLYWKRQAEACRKETERKEKWEEEVGKEKVGEQGSVI